MNEIEFIRSKLDQEELLCQLAEEAAELSQAALKLRRAYSQENPTPVTRKAAYESLLEELADVSLVLTVLGLDTGLVRMEINRTMTEKCERWVGRLDGKKEESLESPISE